MRTARRAGGLASISILSLGCGLEVQSRLLLYWADAAYGYLEHGLYGGELNHCSSACVARFEKEVWVLILFLLVPLMWVFVRYPWLLELLYLGRVVIIMLLAIENSFLLPLLQI
jgi:hypothetical protein